jgi:hypothetical protein
MSVVLTFSSDFYEENRLQKLTRRLKEEPLIPLGCLLTCAALLGATRSIRAGDHNRTNRMFRARIYAQGFTLVAMVAGSMYWDSDRKRRKEFEDVVKEKKAREKNEAWIKELEARDEEEREGRARREARRRGVSYERVREEFRVAEEKVKASRKEQEPKTEAVLEKIVEEGASSVEVVEEPERRKGVLESVQALVWGSGKK